MYGDNPVRLSKKPKTKTQWTKAKHLARMRKCKLKEETVQDVVNKWVKEAKFEKRKKECKEDVN